MPKSQTTIVGWNLGIGIKFEMTVGKEVNKAFGENFILDTAPTEDNSVDSSFPAQVHYHIPKGRYKKYMKKECEF